MGSDPINYGDDLAVLTFYFYRWKDVKRILDMHKVNVPYVVHFEYDFDKTDLLKTVKGELDWFKGVFA